MRGEGTADPRICRSPGRWWHLARRTAKAIKQFWETLPDAYFPPIPRPSMEAFTSMDNS